MAKNPPKTKKAEEDEIALVVQKIKRQIDRLEGFLGGSGGSGSGSSGFGPGSPVTIVDSSGAVIGTGHVDQGGVVRTDITRTTVVRRSSGPSEWSVSTGGFGGTESTSGSDTGPGAQEGGAGPSSFESGLKIPPLFYISPRIFEFHDALENWQETGCAPIYFSYRPFYSPIPIRIDVGVKVGAPKELADGTRIPPWEAQDQAARAAETAALQIIAELRAGALTTGQIQKRFTGYMFGQLALLNQGYRVTGCVPG